MTPRRRRPPSRKLPAWSAKTWIAVAAVVGILALIGWATGSNKTGANLTTNTSPALPTTVFTPPTSTASTASPPEPDTTSPAAESPATNPAPAAAGTPGPGSCHASGSGLYVLPDPSCTPGATNPNVNQADIYQTICKSGWTSTVRPPVSYTEPLKYQQMAEYGEGGSAGNYEEDHLVPLELGGSPTSAQNLWPEPGASPNPKDSVENAANHAVCDGSMTLVAAQQAIAANWITFGQQLGVGTSSSGSSQPPAGAAATCTVTASYNSQYGDYDVYVHSNQPDQTVTVTASGGATASYHTDSSGYADVYLHVTGNPSGQQVIATVGSASCSTTL